MQLMQKLMRKKRFLLLFVGALFFNFKSNAQSQFELEKIANLLNDVIFYSDQYVLPATDAAVYPSSSSWINSPKEIELWQVTLGLHGNTFFIPKSNRSFEIENSDFNFFEIENGTSATVPSALGNNDQTYLVGELGGGQVRLKTPQGINQEIVSYAYLQAGIGLPFGTELIVRYLPKIKLKKGECQIYGLGLNHNISQYFKHLETKNINISSAIIYSKEEMSFDFLNIDTAYGNLGINQLSRFVDTFHFQLSASKEFKNLEVITSVIANTSNFKYAVGGEKGKIEKAFPVQETVNNLLKRISEDSFNILGQISARYQIKKIFLQSSFTFGKFANINLGVQYQF
jgi:hypothetical protein